MPAPPPPPSSGPSPGPDLLSRARKGDDAAFARLLEEHDPVVRMLVHHLVDGRGTDTLVAEAYVKAYRALPRQQGDATPWLLRTAYLAALDELRKRERRAQGGPGRKPTRSRTAGTADAGAEATDEWPLEALGPDRRAVVVLLDGADLAPATVALALGVTDASVAALHTEAHDTLAGLDPPAPAPTRTVLTDVPAPGPDFWAGLGRRLLAEKAAPPAPVPAIAEVGTLGTEPPKAPPLAMQKRAPRAARAARARQGEADPVDRLAVDAERRRTRVGVGTVLRRIVVVVVVVGLVAAGLVAVIRLASRAKSPVRENSVAQVAGRVSQALGRDTFTATFTRTVAGTDGGPATTGSYRVVRNRSGSYLLTGIDVEQAVAYDAPTGTRSERTVLRQPDGTVTVDAAVESGLAAGPPDPSPDEAVLPDTELGLALRTLGAVTDEAAVAETSNGRDLWRLESDLPTREDTDDADRVSLLVDQARLAPVELVFTDGDRPVRRLRFRDVAFDVPAPGPFSVDLSGDPVQPVDRGFRPTTVADATATVGFNPRRPTYLPDGFTLAGVTVRPEGGVVVLRYERGFERVAVSSRTSPVEAGAQWSDPFGDRPGPATDVTLERGAYRDAPVQQNTAVGALPSIWGSDGTIAFTVAGDLTPQDLVRVAESLR